MHPAICRLQIFFHCFINSYNTPKQKSWFINACKSIKMAFEVSWEVPPDRAFLLASVQMAPQLKWWQPVWGDRPFLISSFYVLALFRFCPARPHFLHSLFLFFPLFKTIYPLRLSADGPWSKTWEGKKNGYNAVWGTRKEKEGRGGKGNEVAR